MRFVKTIALLAGVARAGPVLQHPLALSPCAVADDPTPTSEPEPCPTPTLTSVTFNELAPTFYGEEVYIIGNISDLGGWDTRSALHLDSSAYTADYPLWYITVDLPVNTTLEYKYIKKEPDGSITWESDPNRSYIVEGNCDGNATELDSWR